jgi:hypothetical protein
MSTIIEENEKGSITIVEKVFTVPDMLKVLIIGVLAGGFLRQLFMWLQIG